MTVGDAVAVKGSKQFSRYVDRWDALCESVKTQCTKGIADHRSDRTFFDRSPIVELLKIMTHRDERKVVKVRDRFDNSLCVPSDKDRNSAVNMASLNRGNQI